MITHALVPVKVLRQAKSRLAVAIPPAERQALVLEMLERVLTALRHPAATITTIWLVSADPTVLGLGANWGAIPLLETGTDLNAALEQGRTVALAHGAEAILAVPADVPFVTPGDCAALTGVLARNTDVALVTDHAGQGTNALALRRDAALPFLFGEASAGRHLAAAAARGLRAQHLRLASLALDIDQPDGLAYYRTVYPLTANTA
ncbi:MAG: 2-phospho-L-lactate guanylyltransferase [Oscillochloridaceae bacterium umkhey_bin13]